MRILALRTTTLVAALVILAVVRGWATEPNNSPATAQPLTLGVTTTEYISSNTDEDWFRVTISSSTTLPTLTFTVDVPFGLDYDIFVYGPNSSTLVAGVGAAGRGLDEVVHVANAAAGTYYARVYSYWGESSPTALYTIRATLTTPPTITTPSPLPSATLGESYSTPLQATGGATPYNWGLAPGSPALPPGLSIPNNLTGAIVGLPVSYGSYTFTIRVTGADGEWSEKTFALTVSAPAPTITTAFWPNGTVGELYGFSLQGSGGVLPHNWFISGLPPGLGYHGSGLVSGFPTSAGTYPVTVRLTGGNGLYSERSYTVTITFGAPGTFNKSSPSSGATLQPTNTALSWGTSSGASGYEYCIDTTNDNMCGTTWVSTGTSTASTPSLAAGTTYYWQVRAANGGGMRYADGGPSAFWSFTTSGPPSVVAQPQSQSVGFGQSATLAVAATGLGPLRYQWYEGPSGNATSPIPGATAASYTTPALTTTTNYWVRVTNAVGSTNSATATITLILAPAIVTPPASYLVPWGGTTTLGVGVAGSAPLVYQWYQGTSGDTSTPIPGATAAGYTSPALTAPTRIWVRVSNAFGSADSATATVSLGVAGSGTMRKTDFNGDGEADIAVWRPSTGTWFIWRSDGTVTVTPWGSAGDVPVAGDYDGDNKTDIAIWRPSTGEWWVLKSSDGTLQYRQWGAGSYGDIPVPGDYDGDNKTDIGIWRASTGEWWVLKSSDGTLQYRQWGAGSYGDVPVPGDYDGDHKTDIAIWRPSTGEWWVWKSSDDTLLYRQWGAALYGDIPVPGDYDGDHKTDIAIWRPSTGEWWVVKSSDGTLLYRQWGGESFGDRPVAGTDDHDGDGKTDFTVWRAPSGFWYGLDSASGYGTYWQQHWGVSTDVPVVD